MIFTEAEAEVNIIYLGTRDPYINLNTSQQLYNIINVLAKPVKVKTGKEIKIESIKYDEE
jgi:hypothetical protein